MIPSEFKEQRVRHELLEVCRGDSALIDGFITGTKDDRWRNKLTQSQNVCEWIEDPGQIKGIQGNLGGLRSLLKRMPKPVNVLDVGCYGGYVYDYIRKFVFNKESKFNYTGLDIREPAIEGARQSHKDCVNSSFLPGDVYKLKEIFGEKRFDLVFCSRVLIHLPFFENAVSNMLHVCSKVLFLVLYIEDDPCCKKMMKIDLDTGEEMVYFYRSFSREMIHKISACFGLNCRISRHQEGYSSVVFFKLPERDIYLGNLLNTFGLGSPRTKIG